VRDQRRHSGVRRRVEISLPAFEIGSLAHLRYSARGMTAWSIWGQGRAAQPARFCAAWLDLVAKRLLQRRQARQRDIAGDGRGDNLDAVLPQIEQAAVDLKPFCAMLQLRRPLDLVLQPVRRAFRRWRLALPPSCGWRRRLVSLWSGGGVGCGFGIAAALV
jgi:hypothetical protein